MSKQKPILAGLTPLESEILAHRLEVPDCIGDALEGEIDEDAPLTDVCNMLLRGDVDKARGAFGTELVYLVLADAVESSCYLGAAKHNVSDAQLRAIRRATESLADKVGTLIGKRLIAPHC